VERERKTRFRKISRKLGRGYVALYVCLKSDFFDRQILTLLSNSLIDEYFTLMLMSASYCDVVQEQ